MRNFQMTLAALLCMAANNADAQSVRATWPDGHNLQVEATWGPANPTVPPPAPDPKPQPRKPRRSKCAGELEACRQAADECAQARQQLESELAVTRAERDAAREDLATCSDEAGECQQANGELREQMRAHEARIGELEGEIAKLKKPAPPEPAPPPAADKPQGRAPVRGGLGRTTTVGGSVGGTVGTEDLTPFTTKSRGANPQ